MKRTLFFIIVIFQTALVGQTIISGKVVDKKGTPIIGANVYLDGTYDGTSTNDKGMFSFTTDKKGVQVLTVSFVSYETYIKKVDVKKLKNVLVQLREDLNTLDAVVVNAGTLEAGDNAKVTALKPLDIVTTAGAMGDFVGALQTLPGTSTVAEDGRLFVRGGDAEETQIFVDGLRMFTPYSPTVQNIPTRGRLSPFLFKGISFSTGGYSAEYGQALSSVLSLKSIDEPQEERTDISLMTVGLGFGNTQKWKKSSLSLNTSYVNLAPYQSAFPDRNEWHRPFQAFGGESVYRYKFKNDGLLKVYGAMSFSDFSLTQEDINITEGIRFDLKNRNLYVNTSYEGFLQNNWNVSSGISFNNDKSDISIINDEIEDLNNSAHFKIKLKKHFSNRFKLSVGSEYFITSFKEDYRSNINGNFNYGFNNNIFASFTEADIFFSKKMASKVGLRAEYSELLQEFTLSPRFSLAYKTGSSSQMSIAYGQFYQTPRDGYLKFHTNFKSENTSHIIANFQYVKNKQIFRAEAYYKNYTDLVKYDTDVVLPISTFTNSGNGYAKGIDLFWRDNKSFKNTDYWISYSFLDTERDYKNYPTKATPNFASKHNLSMVLKHFVTDWKSQLGLSYNFASGRAYTDPNMNGFLNRQLKNYNTLNANWAYLISPQKILFVSVTNILGTRNVNGYQFKNTPNLNGFFERRTISPAVDTFFFVGFFWTISSNKDNNQLNNL